MEFLECFGLQSLDDLPRALSPEGASSWKERRARASRMIRLQKVLADRGVASRRAAEELMREGRVRVAGEVVREMGSKVPPDARIEVDGRAVGGPAPHRYVVLNKPRGSFRRRATSAGARRWSS